VGKTALAGQPGVADVVKAMRGKPFGEWVVAYYDATKTTPDKLLERLKKNGCEQATRVAPVAVEKDKKKATVANPIAVAGDFVEILLEGNDKIPAVAVPEKWSVISRDAKRVVVQTPLEAKEGSYAIKFGEMECTVTLVPLIK
jgi:hypothetical protein